MIFWSILGALIVAYFVWALVTFSQSYAKAREIGLPILSSPIAPNNPLWLLLKDRLIPVISALPYGLGDWAARAEVGWTIVPRFSIHARYGLAFTIVAPGSHEIYLADPAAVDEVTRRRNDFIKDPDIYGMLEFYGPNLDTVNGKQWDRHRRITVPPFNEQNSALVWKETADQAEQILETWSQKPYVTSTQYDVHAVALNVLCGAGFGQHSSFVDDTSVEVGAQQRLGYRESLRLLLAHIVQLVLLTILVKAGIPRWMFVGQMKEVGTAFDEFKMYMVELLQKEKTAYDQGDLTRHNLMSALVRASEESKESASNTTAANEGVTAGLTDEEVLGNLFIYNLAGHDTTAATLHFAITLLAINPQWQEWLADEIDQVRQSDTSGIWYYEQTFPKLPRCLALMYETLRLHGPVVMMPRSTGNVPQHLKMQGKDYVLPARTSITINFAALHTDPASWGADALDWRPDRWLPPSKSASEDAASFFQPTSGSFVAWNSGPRICPGKKFSQVEFVRLVYTLFADGSRVELVPDAGEGVGDARRRATKIVNSAKVEVTLKMADSEKIKLRWTKGKGAT